MGSDDAGGARKLRVFLCHASEDKPAMRDLHARLAADGFQPWLDEEDLFPEEEWEPAIRRAVREADVVLVCLSRHSMKQGFVQKEIRIALDAADERPPGAIYVIPLRLEECAVPERLARWQWADLRDDAGYRRLLRSLSRCADRSGITVGRRQRTNPRDGATLLWVPPGEFLMGTSEEQRDAFLSRHPESKREGFADEMPQRKVALDGYWVCRDPVTVGQYRAFCSTAGLEMPGAPSWGWQDDHPVVNVSWEDARAYCAWAGMSLPTEAQWEKAARGTDGRVYPWSNEWDPAKCHCSRDGWGDAGGTAPVGSFPDGASPYGCLDMAGNVLEWCADWYAEDYYRSAPDRNPPGPDEGEGRVLRGGAWYVNQPEYFRAAFRIRLEPDLRGGSVGFRCVAPADSG